jgi:hypothetical protein
VKITPILHRKTDQADYADRMAAATLAQPGRPKRDDSWKSMTREQLKAHRESIQNPHVLKVMNMSSEELAKYRDRPMPAKEDWKRETDAEKIQGEMIAKNPTRINDLAIAEHERHKSKNTQGDAVSEGATSVSPVKVERAIEAYIHTPPAPMTDAQKAGLNRAELVRQETLRELTKIEQYSGPVVEVEKKKPGFWSRLFGTSKTHQGDIGSIIDWRDLK